MVDAFATADAIQDDGLFIVPFGRNENSDRFSDDFGGLISKDALGAVVPGQDNSLQGLAENGVIGGFDNAGDAAQLDLHAFAALDFGAQKRGFLLKAGKDDVLPGSVRGPQGENPSVGAANAHESGGVGVGGKGAQGVTA